jgi:hypothetical protein
MMLQTQGAATQDVEMVKGEPEVSVLDEGFAGDAMLAKLTRFISEALVSFIATQAVRDNNNGLIWECMKRMTYTFAGSSHHKYAGYMLEMICSVELESSPVLKKLILSSMTVNIAGLPGHGIAADMFQEQIQDELYEHINRKDASFNADYIKNVIAPNTHRFVALKKDVNAGLGLAWPIEAAAIAHQRQILNYESCCQSMHSMRFICFEREGSLMTVWIRSTITDAATRYWRTPN